MSDIVVYELRDDGVALIRMDDGKANAISHALLDALLPAVERACSEAKALVLAGREGRFSAGFDLSVMSKGGKDSFMLLDRGLDFSLALYTAKIPTVAACTGHALAMGALTLLSCDLRVGAAGAYKLGLNETAIGMVLPPLGTELAEARLSKRHLVRATVLAEIYDPQGAVDAGFLDRVVDADAVIEAACEDAARTAQLSGDAVAGTKAAVRADTVARIEASRTGSKRS